MNGVRLQDRRLVGHEFDLRHLDRLDGGEVVVIPRFAAEEALRRLDEIDKSHELSEPERELRSWLRYGGGL